MQNGYFMPFLFLFLNETCKSSRFLQIKKHCKTCYFTFFQLFLSIIHTRYEIIEKQENSVLHTFLSNNVKTCENMVFETDFALFDIFLKICKLCKIIFKSAKPLFCRSFYRIVENACKTAISCVF